MQGDAGLTGRKIIVDTYGGWGAHGGGAFSGKDFSKVDRSAAYAARWVAKSLVKAGLCKRVLVQVSVFRDSRTDVGTDFKEYNVNNLLLTVDRYPMPLVLLNPFPSQSLVMVHQNIQKNNFWMSSTRIST